MEEPPQKRRRGVDRSTAITIVIAATVLPLCAIILFGVVCSISMGG